MTTEGQRDELKGRVKKAAGELTGDDKLKRDGQVDKATGKVKQVADDIRTKLQDED